jgi:hypothetical protein
MAGAFEQQADGQLDRSIVIHDQYSRQSKKFSGPLLESNQRQVASYAESSCSRNCFLGRNVAAAASRGG